MSEDAVKDFVESSFKQINSRHYVEDAGEFALAYFLAKETEERFSVDFLRKALDKKLEISIDVAVKKEPLWLKVVGKVAQGLGTIRMVSNVVKKRLQDALD